MSSTPEQLEAEIEAQREQLADTVDALAAKLDVKAQARDRAQRLQAQARSHTTELAAAGAALVTIVLAWAMWKRSRS